MALGVGLDLVGELAFDGREIIVGEAADIAGMTGQGRALDRLEPNGARHVEPACRRAVEEPRVERELDRFAGSDDRLRRLEGEVEPLGNIILEQELDAADAVAFRVGIGLDRPFSRRRAGEQRDGVGAPAKAAVRKGRALILDPVRPLDDQRQRQPRSRHALRVAKQGGQEHGFAGAVHAALGVEERVERARRVAPRDAAVGKVERILGEAEKTVVVGERRDQKARRRAALAAGEARIEIDPPVGAGRLDRQHFVVARDELERHAGDGRGGAQRLHERVHAVGAGDGGQAEIGDDHPLRRELHRLAGVRVRGIGRGLPRTRGNDIDAGFELADRVEHRKVGDDVLIERGGDVHRPAPHLRPIPRCDLVSPRRIDRLQEVVAVDRGEQVAVADAIDVDRDL